MDVKAGLLMFTGSVASVRWGAALNQRLAEERPQITVDRDVSGLVLDSDLRESIVVDHVARSNSASAAHTVAAPTGRKFIALRLSGCL